MLHIRGVKRGVEALSLQEVRFVRIDWNDLPIIDNICECDQKTPRSEDTNGYVWIEMCVSVSVISVSVCVCVL